MRPWHVPLVLILVALVVWLVWIAVAYEAP
jgi:hypothetical protein